MKAALLNLFLNLPITIQFQITIIIPLNLIRALLLLLLLDSRTWVLHNSLLLIASACWSRPRILLRLQHSRELRIVVHGDGLLPLLLGRGHDVGIVIIVFGGGGMGSLGLDVGGFILHFRLGGGGVAVDMRFRCRGKRKDGGGGGGMVESIHNENLYCFLFAGVSLRCKLALICWLWEGEEIDRAHLPV